MGCGVIRATGSIHNNDNAIDERNRSSSQTNLLIRYQTTNNVYKIKLTPPNSGK